ncbi:glycosyltransferase family 4 protein [Acinetobacter ursingii]|uniref:glycosyltransferase family 4 protein n=1 Tax=Acinetobacter ursingii TaxID=108980 RepID=UPI0022EAE2F1|nr:glycosyltransferase family 1 protein [Acinetobacter ursingii]MDA3580291.1 glycosyltransferase family 4 protein [Acinetobacter ursingii]MDH0808613.1 glycosyltransferase family 4 protein [Acinetobacter ursingii]MDH2075584.1 glycosyltransferase family 4 protein [Acinetobacter ursingii]
MLNQQNKVIFDTRWFGEHGIGRFATEVYDEDFFQPISLNGNPVSIFDVIKLTIYLFFNKNFFFSPGFNAPFFFLHRTAITIHDLNHIDVDANTSFLKKLYYNIVLKRACKKAALIFTVSEFSKERIVDWSGINPEKVKVVYNGVSSAFHQNVQPYLPGFPYIFIVGNRKLHKNEDRALRAFSQAKIDKNIHVLFSGKPSDQLVNTAKELQIEDRVKFLGRLSEDELASTYKGALCLLFPSLYEGFGLPVIEAMACGTPVITSNTTSLVEIANNSAILVDPLNHTSITNGIKRIYNNNPLTTKLIHQGLENSYQFQWNKSKSDLISIIKKNRGNK